MERENTIFSGLFGFHVSLFIYFLISGNTDVTLHVMIFSSGVLAVLLFAISKVTFESRVAFVITLAVLITTFTASALVPFGGQIFRWLIVVLYNIAQSRTMRLVDIQRASRQNIIVNTVMLALNVAYEVVL